MPELFVAILIFVVSLTVLVKASDFFTDVAERLGMTIGLPAFVVGVTIVSLGTSIPELVSSVIAVLQGASDVVISNVVGSNIANICLVLGLTSIFSAKSLQITYDLVSVDLPLFAGSAFLLALMAWDQDFSAGEALLLLLGYCIYLFYIFKSSNVKQPAQPSGAEGLEPPASSEESSVVDGLQQLLLLVVSAIFIFLGARYTIDSLIRISDLLAVGRDVIAVSAVALGTSLPELIVSLNAARRGKAEIAVGNVLGSNIFNIFMVMGIPGLIGPLTISNGILATGIPTLISATLLMFFATQDKKLTVWEGWLFFIVYAWFIGHTFGWV